MVKNVPFFYFEPSKNKNMSTNSSTEANRHPYLRVKFWQNTDNWYWINDKYSKKSQDEMSRQTVEWCNNVAKKKITSVL